MYKACDCHVVDVCILREILFIVCFGRETHDLACNLTISCTTYPPFLTMLEASPMASYKPQPNFAVSSRIDSGMCIKCLAKFNNFNNKYY